MVLYEVVNNDNERFGLFSTKEIANIAVGILASRFKNGDVFYVKECEDIDMLHLALLVK